MRRRATYDDLRTLPEHLVGEIIDGDLIVSPRPASPHARASSVLGHDVGGPFDTGPGGPGGWWILDEPELHFGNDVLVPDLAGWRRERMPQIPKVAAFELPPDWVCEVISESTEAVDRGRKLQVYGRVKVANVWLLNPLSRTLEIYRLEGKNWLLIATHVGDQKVRAEPFDAVELEMSRWWL